MRRIFVLKRIGYFLKPHGVRGLLKLRLEGPSLADACWQVPRLYVSKADEAWLEKADSSLAYDVLRFSSMRPGVALLGLAGITSREEVEALKESVFYLRAKDMGSEQEEVHTALSKEEENWLFFSKLKGYTLHVGGRACGELTDFMPQANNPLLVLRDEKDQERLIPAQKEWVEAWDETAKVLHMTLPDGLLEL